MQDRNIDLDQLILEYIKANSGKVNTFDIAMRPELDSYSTAYSSVHWLISCGKVRRDLNENLHYIEVNENKGDTEMDVMETYANNLKTNETQTIGWVEVETQGIPSKQEFRDIILGFDAFYNRIGEVEIVGNRLVLVESDDCSITHWINVSKILPSIPKEHNGDARLKSAYKNSDNLMVNNENNI